MPKLGARGRAGDDPDGSSSLISADQARANLSFPTEVDKQPAPVLGVLLHAVIQRLDLLLVEEPQYPLLQLARALTRNDLHQRRLLGHRLVDDPAQRPVDVLAPVEDVVQVELELHGLDGTLDGAAPPREPPTPPGPLWT